MRKSRRWSRLGATNGASKDHAAVDGLNGIGATPTAICGDPNRCLRVDALQDDAGPRDRNRRYEVRI